MWIEIIKYLYLGFWAMLLLTLAIGGVWLMFDKERECTQRKK